MPELVDGSATTTHRSRHVRADPPVDVHQNQWVAIDICLTSQHEGLLLRHLLPAGYWGRGHRRVVVDHHAPHRSFRGPSHPLSTAHPRLAIHERLRPEADQ